MAFGRKFLHGMIQIIHEIKQEVKQEAALPRGTVCWFCLPSAPEGWAVCDGTNGTPDLIGRYAVGSKTDIGTTLDPQLPNVTGQFSYQYAAITGASGVFTQIGKSGTYASSHNRGGNGTVTFSLGAANSYYVDNGTVRPASTVLLPCMKL